MSDAQYQELRSIARVLEADADGDKVLLLADGRIMKLFRPPEDHEYLDTTHRRALIDRYLKSCPEQLVQDSQFRAGIELCAQL